MKYIDEIKNAIAEVIKPNGNQEITGQVLQDILVSVVGKLGQSFDDQIGETTVIKESIAIGSTTAGPRIRIGSSSGAQVYIGYNNKKSDSISILGNVSIGTNTFIGEGFNAKEGVTIGNSVNIYNGAAIGTNAVIGSGINIGTNGMIIPNHITIGYSNSDNGVFYLGTGIQYNESSADNFTQLPIQFKITYNSAGITFKTPNGQITLNYGS